MKQPIIVRAETGEIIDGHHRWQIAKELEVTCPQIEVELSDEDAFNLGLSLNTDRRQLSLIQIKKIREKLRPIVKKLKEQGKTQEEIASLTNMPQSTISKWLGNNTTNIHTDNTCNVAPDCRVKLPKNAQKTIYERYKKGETQAQIAADYKITQQRVAQIIKKEELTQKENMPSANIQWQNNSSITLLEGAFQEQTKTIPDDSIDIIITDPPYGEQYLDLYEQLGQVSKRLLKPAGSLLVMTGQSYLPDVFNLLRQSLTYNWIVAYLTPGGQSAQLWERKVNTFWKPVVWFVKGKYEGNWVGDVVKSAPNDNEKQHMKWQQSESGIADLVERFTKPNNLILDPLMGSGTTGVVASRLGRRFIGIDVDPKMVEIAKQRMGI